MKALIVLLLLIGQVTAVPMAEPIEYTSVTYDVTGSEFEIVGAGVENNIIGDTSATIKLNFESINGDIVDGGEAALTDLRLYMKDPQDTVSGTWTVGYLDFLQATSSAVQGALNGNRMTIDEDLQYVGSSRSGIYNCTGTICQNLPTLPIHLNCDRPDAEFLAPILFEGNQPYQEGGNGGAPDITGGFIQFYLGTLGAIPMFVQMSLQGEEVGREVMFQEPASSKAWIPTYCS